MIKIFGARENNLKNISLEIPKNKLVVCTGLSGSGKSTLLKSLYGAIQPKQGSLIVGGAQSS